jgi:anti-sigma regulatory factor (Ser/Thr protein kinase)
MMAPFVTYTATSWRDGPAWAVRVLPLDRTAQATRLSEVEATARQLICAETAANPEDVRVVLDLRVPDGIAPVLAAAAAALDEADHVSAAAVALRRTLARRLADHGYGIREIAVILGVSYARAKQLAEPQAEGRSAWTPRPGPAAEHQQKPHSSYQHEAFMYRDEDEFLAGTVDFVLDAVALRQPVMVALIKPRLQLLTEALGRAADQVILVDMGELGGNPARIIPAWLSFVEQHGGLDKPVRGIGEPQWAGRRPEEAIECQLHEGLLNVAVDPDIPLWLRCPYDVSALTPPLIDAALHSHPALVERGAFRGSTSYGGLDHVESVFRSELPPAPPGTDAFAFAGADLVRLRVHVAQRAAEAGLDRQRALDLAHAVSEIAANSVRHGGGRGELLTWVQPGALVCEVSDRGRLSNPMVGRRIPRPEADKGRGLWLANQLSDLIQIRSTPKGTAARVFTWL